MKKLMQFSASWCQPCKQLTKTLESVDLGIPLQYIDVDENQELTTQYAIRGVPTLVLIDEGAEVKRISGARSSQELQEWVSQ